MPVQIGWLEMGWQLRPNEVEGREREEDTTKREEEGKAKAKKRKAS